MPPKFADHNAWQQAELLMQPAFIRILDRIRKQLDTSSWKETYENVLIWPPGTSEETKAEVANLVKQLESAQGEQVEKIEQALMPLPTPTPGYHLCLQQEGLETVKVDLWELCYQVCFQHYSPLLAESPNYTVAIDTNLIDDTGDVDWQLLDEKAAQLIERIFAELPTT
jgi:hypothetical protein